MLDIANRPSPAHAAASPILEKEHLKADAAITSRAVRFLFEGLLVRTHPMRSFARGSHSTCQLTARITFYRDQKFSRNLLRYYTATTQWQRALSQILAAQSIRQTTLAGEAGRNKIIGPTSSQLAQPRIRLVIDAGLRVCLTRLVAASIVEYFNARVIIQCLWPSRELNMERK